jgi:hypothetical protein
LTIVVRQSFSQGSSTAQQSAMSVGGERSRLDGIKAMPHVVRGNTWRDQSLHEECFSLIVLDPRFKPIQKMVRHPLRFEPLGAQRHEAEPPPRDVCRQRLRRPGRAQLATEYTVNYLGLDPSLVKT